jgi:hypothetical protein
MDLLASWKAGALVFVRMTTIDLDALSQAGDNADRNQLIQLGELLREYTFVGEGRGAVDNFDVRASARVWSDEEVLAALEEGLSISDAADQRYDLIVSNASTGGCTYALGPLEVDVLWKWESDGSLSFVIRRGQEELLTLYNPDCKKTDNWV